MNETKYLLLEKIKHINKKYRERICMDFENLDNEEFNVEISETGDGMKTIRLVTEDKEIFLFSKYSVKDEIERFIDEIKGINTQSIIIVFGLGLGYHIIKLCEKISEYNKVLIIEPSIKVFAKTLEIGELEKIVKDNININIIIGQDIKKVNEYFYRNINSDNLNNVYLSIFGQYGNVFGSYMNEVYEGLKEAIINEEVNLATEYHFQYEFSGNVIRNIPYLLESESILELEGRFKGYPAIIVSAGPSLDKNIHELRKAQGKAIIISGGRTLKPLLRNGIDSNFVVSIDPGYPAYELLEDFLDCEVPLISLVISNHDIIKKYKGKHFIVNKYPYSEFINNVMDKDIPILPNGGSVAHSSTVLANYMGCNPIVLVGQDLAFTNQKMHSEQAIIEGRENDKKEGAILVEDIYGNEVYTSKPLLSFLKWFEKYFSVNENTKFIDASEGGVKINGAEICTLKETITQYCKDVLPDYQDLLVNRIIPSESYEKTIVLMEKACNDFETMKKLIDRGLKLLGKVHSYYKTEKNININKVLEKLDYIDNTIIEKNNSSILLTSVIMPMIRRINLDKDLLEKFEETESEKGLRIARKNKLLYEEILNSINLMKPLIEETIDVVKQKAGK